MSLYSSLAEYLQFISPEFYKKRFFKKLSGLRAENILDRKIEPELYWVKKSLPKDAVFMDIGANVGAYIFRLEKHLKPENIFAFEPNQHLYKRLKRIFPKVHIFDIALSDQDTTAEFKIPVMNGKKIHTRGTLQTDVKENGETASKIEKVTVKTLDIWMETNNPKRLDFIKIDVEGNELQTLRGAEQSVRKFRPAMMVEIEQRHHDFPIWNIIYEVESWGFSANYLDRTTLSPTPLTKELIEKQDAAEVKAYKNYINNIIFLPKK